MHPGLWEKPGFSGLLAIPERRPEILTPIIILGDTTSPADGLHEAIPADALQAVGEPFAQFI